MNKQNLVIWIAGCTALALYVGCGQPAPTAELPGKKLAASYCGSCHLAPDPGLLPKDIWKSNVLPVMSNFMGLHYVGDSVEPLPASVLGEDSAVLPARVPISPAEFTLIAQYYLATAPDSLAPIQRKHPVVSASDLFEVRRPALVNAPPFTTSLLIDSVQHNIYQGDAAAREIRVLDSGLKVREELPIQRIATDLQIHDKALWVTSIGALKPGPGMGSGDIIRLSAGGGSAGPGVAPGATVMLDGLSRSVQSIQVDLDNDGKLDWVVCEFGFLKGNFYWYKNLGNGKYQRQLLRATPGAERAYIEDVDRDGRPDIWVLFAQAREGISLFLNKGNGHFEEKHILQFPPVYGSTYFQLVDLNGDGKEDIIYTCGDNADYSPVLKPYHGVYIYLNQGKYQFKQSYFFPMYGCYKAMAVAPTGRRGGSADHGVAALQSGSSSGPDLACISYFADYAQHPEESFIYLKNISRGDSLDFLPYTIDHLPSGRWICMDVGDVDGDGYPDIALGNMAAPFPGHKEWTSQWMQVPPFVVLRNLEGHPGQGHP